VCFNSNFNFIGASNNQGYINIFPNNKNQIPNSSPQEELSFLKNSDAAVNSFRFSPLLDSIIASAQDDGVVAIYDVNSRQTKPNSTFLTHKASVRGVAFSPLNKLLLSSISLDK
jgi:WD40 repeat protein